MADDAQKVVIVGAIALVTSCIAAINEFTKLLDFVPFWTDVLVAFGAIAAAFYLLQQALRKRYETIIRPDESFLQRLVRNATPLVVPILCAAIGVFSLARPATNLASGPWSACGTVLVVGQCGSPKCIKLYDDRERQVTRQCFSLDGANYFNTSLQDRSQYFPKKLSIRCGKDEGALVSLPATIVNNSLCDASVRVQ